LPDSIADLAEVGVRGHPLYGLDRRPPNKSAALLGDPAPVHGGVGLVVFRGQPGPAGQLCRAAEPGGVKWSV
jgi:hypothetical protein